MTESAEALAANQKARRNVTIEITNVTRNYCLLDPKVYLDSGNVHSPPQPTVRPLRTEVCNFTKDSGKASGVVGVMSYSLLERGRGIQGQVVIMFSIPYDYRLYENWLAIGFFKKKDVNKGLFNYMYNDKEQKDFKRQKSNGSMLNFESELVDIKATMSPMGRCMLKVEIWDKFFGPPKHQTKC